MISLLPQISLFLVFKIQIESTLVNFLITCGGCVGPSGELEENRLVSNMDPNQINITTYSQKAGGRSYQ